MSYSIIVTIERAPAELGGVMFSATTNRPGVMDSRQDDEVRTALLEQAARQAREMLDKEMLAGDFTISADPSEDFKRAVHLLDSLGLLDVTLPGPEEGDDPAYD